MPSTTTWQATASWLPGRAIRGQCHYWSSNRRAGTSVRRCSLCTSSNSLTKHPMSRALRVDKLTLAALPATLAIYRRGESDPTAYDEIPFLRMLRTTNEELESRARNLAERLFG